MKSSLKSGGGGGGGVSSFSHPLYERLVYLAIRLSPLSFILNTEPMERYVGHTELVTNIIYQHDQLISASWDRLV